MGKFSAHIKGGDAIITLWQFILLTVNFMLGTTLFKMSAVMIELGQQNAWLIPWWAGGFGIAVALFVALLHRYYPGKTFVQILMEVFGSFIGKGIALFYFFYFSFLTAWVLRNLSDFLTATYMPQTPISVFHLMFLVVAAYTVSKGIETVAGVNQFVTPLLFFSFWISVMLGFPEWEWQRFQPVLHMDVWQVMRNSHPFIAFPFLEWLVFFMIYPLVKRGAGRGLVLGIGISAVSISIMYIFLIGLLGVERAEMLAYPVYTFVQEISIGEVITNIHAVISMVFAILVYIKVLVLFYGAYASLKQIFRPETNWPVLLALIVFIGALAWSGYKNPIQNLEFIKTFYFLYTSLFVIIIPAILLVITWFKNALNKREGVSAK
jgi:spore germination protein KB